MDNRPQVKKASLCMAPMGREPCASGAGRHPGELIRGESSSPRGDAPGSTANRSGDLVSLTAPPAASRPARASTPARAAAHGGAVLAERYGSWKLACKAAYGLKPDGRTLGRSHHAWPHPARGKPWIEPYTVDEVVWAVRRCGLELACRPMSTTYIRWSARKRRLARVNNRDVRIPTRLRRRENGR